MVCRAPRTQARREQRRLIGYQVDVVHFFLAAEIVMFRAPPKAISFAHLVRLKIVKFSMQSVLDAVEGFLSAITRRHSHEAACYRSEPWHWA